MAELDKVAIRAIKRAQQIINSLKVDAENDAMTNHRWGEKKLEHASQQLLEADTDLRAALAALERPRGVPVRAERRDPTGQHVRIPVGVAVGQMDPWQAAVDDAPVCHALDCTGPDSDPVECVSRLIRVAVEMALDPAISERAKALIDRGAGVEGRKP